MRLQGLGKLQDSAVGDLWLPTTVFIANAVTLGIGISRAASSANVRRQLQSCCPFVAVSTPNAATTKSPLY